MNVSADVDILMGCFNSNTWKITSKQAEGKGRQCIV